VVSARLLPSQEANAAAEKAEEPAEVA
jgi:hypothetical protein